MAVLPVSFKDAVATVLRLINTEQLSKEIKSTMPFLVPFLKMTCIYFVLLLEKGTFPAAVVKCLPLLSLIWFVCLLGVSDPVRHCYNRRVLAALSWSCAGDFFLVWGGVYEAFFLLGLGCFAIGHFLYSHAFGWKPFGLKEFVFTFALCIPVLAGIVQCVTGVMKYAVFGYGVLLSIMHWRSLARFNLKQREVPWRKIYAAIGASLFVISDTVLAVNKFCTSIAGERYIIMATYYAAQFFIALSVVNSAIVVMSTSDNGVAGSNEQNRNVHLNRALSEGNMNSAATVNVRRRENRNEFHLNGTTDTST